MAQNQVQASRKINRGEQGKSGDARGEQGTAGGAYGDCTPGSAGDCVGVGVRSTDSAEAGCAGGYGRPEARAGGEIIEPFDPEDEDGNIDRWLNKIDQLGRIHSWSDYEKSCFMQAKLRGAARGWFNRLEEYDLSWGEWKARLKGAFPRRCDFAELLEELVARRKLPSESMTRYYHAKLALCGRCDIQGERATSCIIKGLPLNLQATARAFKAQSPEEFYTGFLAGLDHYQADSDLKRRNSDQESFKVKAKRPTTGEQTAQKGQSITALKVRCYNCQELGNHLSRDCPRPRMDRCMRCGKGGHNRMNCSTMRKAGTTAMAAKGPGPKEHGGQVRLVNKDSSYKKVAITAQGERLRAYLDTGSAHNIVTHECARRLANCTLRPVSVILRGFGGGSVSGLGEVSLSVTVDDVNLDIEAVVVDYDLAGADILLGEPALSREGTILTVKDGKAMLSRPDELIKAISLEATIKEKLRVRLAYDEVILPNMASEVAVHVEDARRGEVVFVEAQKHEEQGALVAIPNVRLEVGEASGETTMAIINFGQLPLKWRAGHVVARARRCNSDVHIIRRIEVSDNNYSSNVLDLSRIEVGDIGENDRALLMNLLREWAICFSTGETDLGLTQLGQMKIQVTSDKPIYYRPYRLSLSERKVVRDKVQNLLESGVIRESNSNYASPIVLIPKKNGDVRMCVDYRALNRITLKDRHPLPLVSDQLDKLAGKCFYTTLDLAQGYHQVPVHPDSVSKTSFITPDGQYEYLRVPFGLANAPAVFQRVVNKMLGGLQNDSVLAYMDDLLIPSTTVEEGVQLLERVLQLIAQAGLKLNLEKCSFLKDRLEYLGHEISADGVQPGVRKIEAVRNFPCPENVHGVRQFLGLASYFRKFIRNFAVIAKPLSDLTKKDVAWHWGAEQAEAFEFLKQSLAERPVLALYDSQADVEIHTDACKSGLGGILLQKQADNTWRPVFYFSRTTSRTEQVYHSYELETLALVETVKRFRVYLVGIHFKAVTDCAAVRATMLKRDLVPRVARWWITLQEYDMELEYRPGVKMQHVDALSRNPIDVNLVSVSEKDWFLTVQLQDDKAQAIVMALTSHKADKGLKAEYKVYDGRLYRRTLLGDRLYVPAMARFNLVRKHHDDVGHPGYARCLQLIKQAYWFPKMGRFVRKYVTACLDCAFSKGDYGRAEGLLHPIKKPTVPFDTVHVDHLGPFAKSVSGHSYILMLVDGFTKFTLAKPTRTLRSTEAIGKLKEIFGEFGYPRRLISDRGLAFTSKAFSEFLAGRGVRHVLNAIATPRANGQVERQNRTIIDAIGASADTEVRWDESLSDIIWGMNNCVNSSSGFSPSQLMFSHQGNGVMADLSGGVHGVNASNGEGENFQEIQQGVLSRRRKATENLTMAGEAMKARFDKRRKVATEYKTGDLVLWRDASTCVGEKGVNRKLTNKYGGPYKVTKVLGNDRYKIVSVKGVRGYKRFEAIVAVNSLRRYHSTLPGEGVCNVETEGDGETVDRQDLIDLLES